MSVKQSDYEALLSQYSNRKTAIELLRQHRPYLEMIPSLRRPEESLITIPLPVARIRQPPPEGKGTFATSSTQTLVLPCDLAILMCDPEWKIKMGVEIIVLIHRPEEDFSQLLSRWRSTQVYLDRDYEWLMAPCDRHIFSEGADKIYPLFILLEETPERIKRGLQGACLPFVIQKPELLRTDTKVEVLAAD